MVDQILEGEVAQEKIEWEVLEPEQLLRILASTFEETVFQDLTAIELNQDNGNMRASKVETDKLAKRMRTITHVLHHPAEPLPISNKFPDHPIISLDHVVIK